MKSRYNENNNYYKRMDRKQRDKCSCTFSYKKVIKKTVLQDWKRGQMLYSEKEKATFIL